MAVNPNAEPHAMSVAQAQLERVSASGLVRHRHLNFLLDSTGRDSGRDLADSIHLLCHVHGWHPGLIGLAEQRAPAGPVREWLERASAAFERERLYLVRLTAAVGPVPSTPGAAQCEASLAAARNALETLAQSERSGCALGAATALVGDWWPIRRLLDRAAHRAGIECPAPSLPDEGSVRTAIDALCVEPSSCRALGFGGEQLLLQHRALFDLLEARAEARADY